MNLIVLAAGKGNRMGVLTRDKPKLLLNLGSNTLLERQLQSFKDSDNIDTIIYVIGYFGESIEEHLIRLDAEKVVTVFNPFYDAYNNLISLWLAKYYMDTDFAITNGDNLFDASVLRKAFSHKDGIYLAVNKKNRYDNDDMKVVVKNGNVNKVSKLIFEGATDYESVGLAVVSGKRFRDKFKKTLEKLVRSKDYLDKFWLEVFNVLAREKVAITPFQIEGNWREFDYHADISNYFAESPFHEQRDKT